MSPIPALPVFRHESVVLDYKDLRYNPCNDVIYPSVFEAGRYLKQPLGRYYLYYAPHNPPGGICLAYADSLAGPWREYPHNPVITREWPPNYRVSHVSGPDAIWNPEEQKLFLYFHGENPVTRVASSTNGIDFAYEGTAITTAAFEELSEASYGRVSRYTLPGKDNRYIMLLMGNDRGTRRIYLAWSKDGRAWEARRSPVLDPPPGTDQVAGAWYFPWQGRHYLIAHANRAGNGGSMNLDFNLYAAEVDSAFEHARHLGRFYDRTSVSPTNEAVMSPCIISEGNQHYLFVNIGPRLHNKIALARAESPEPSPRPVESIGGKGPPRAARSVHLGWQSPECELFYLEMTVEQSTPGSYFMACGWNTGYFGIQELTAGRKVAIFSVWDPTKGDDPKLVKPEDRVALLHAGEGVRIRRFGGEGTGGQCMMDFPWEIGATNRFLLRAMVESNKTAYAGYLYLPQQRQWKHLVTFRTRTGGAPLKGLYSFLEDFRRDGKSVGERRQARFGNGWVKTTGGQWMALSQARFTASGAAWEAKDNINAGLLGEQFLLITGGETRQTQKLRSMLEAPAPGSAHTLHTELEHLVSSAGSRATRPNVLFIAVDDLNDWVGCLGGHPQVKTPHLDRLAACGTVFLNAHVQAPLCNPSRASVLTGLRPSTTGIYGLAPGFRTVPALKEQVTLPQHFAANGYYTFTCGKIHHDGTIPWRSRTNEFQAWGDPGPYTNLPSKKFVTTPDKIKLMDWGIYPARDEDQPDWHIADSAITQLKSLPEDKPFFVAVGFRLPHVPCYATRAWFDLYPDSEVLLPKVKEDDRTDTPPFSWYLHWKLPEPRLSWLRANDQWLPLVRAYLASISFMDSQVGRVLNALEATGRAGNTVVVLWSDNGWHLGEKAITGKNSLWERSTRVPLIFAGPGVSPGGRCRRPAELLDIYPTLIELCELPPRPGLEGHSLAPQLKDSNAPRLWPAITTHNQNNHAVRSVRWRYIRYADGSEELYDTESDPNEWTNLAQEPQHARVLSEHRQWLPKVNAAPVPGSAQRVLTYDPGTREAIWEGRRINPAEVEQ